MRHILHILTRTDDPLPRELLAWQQSSAGVEAEVMDLTLPEPDYKELLEKIFAADSIESW